MTGRETELGFDDVRIAVGATAAFPAAQLNEIGPSSLHVDLEHLRQALGRANGRGKETEKGPETGRATVLSTSSSTAGQTEEDQGRHDER